MKYRKEFNPEHVVNLAPSGDGAAAGDRRDGSVYVYTDEIVLAVNVALATGRPLLLRGPSGSGKSTLARNVARVLGWRYYEDVISSRTQARDLLWRFDTLRRLSDAQVKRLEERLYAYIDPGVLWWAFDRTSALRRGAPDGVEVPLAAEPAQESRHERAVVLLDEIDKADPDVPNNLLVPLGSLEFTVQEIDERIQGARPPLIFITTNDERELPPAFLRRCIVLTLAGPDRTRLTEIARAHFGDDDKELYEKVAGLVLEQGAEPAAAGGRRDRRVGQAVPSTAEYLDAVRACRKLKIRPENEIWSQIAQVTLWKPRDTAAAGR